MSPPRQEITLKYKSVHTKTVLKIALALILFGTVVFFLPQLQTVFTVVIIALLCAFLLDPVVSFFENRGLERLSATVIVFLIITVIAVGLFYALAPSISNEVKQISQGLENQTPDSMMQKLQDKLGEKSVLLSNPLFQEALRTKVNTILQQAISTLVNGISKIISLVMIVFITFFFLKDGRRMKKAVVRCVPNRYFEMTLVLLHKTGSKLGRYIRGQLIVAAIVGSLSIFALYLLEIRYAFFIGAIAGLANMIPYFGPLVGAVPAVVIAFIDTGSFGPVIVVIVAFASIQLIENVFVSPFIVARSVELHPLTTILVVLVGGQLFGILGMLLAVPAASIIKVTITQVSWGLKNYQLLE